jgi:myo-inositol 2-dehydrogenase / D-chiro-inositol 1-dehydrogenase
MTKDAGFSVDTGPELPTRRIGVIGCGRIGRMHASMLARDIPGYQLAAVADAVPAAAEGVSAATGAPVLTIEQLLAADDVDTVAICSSTDTHVDLVVAAAAAGKAIFCEKPVSLDLAQVDRALVAVEQAGVPFMIGFNRRFDPGHKSVRDRVAEGGIGELHVLRITSRDPAPPPPEYVAVSGGIFLDMVIHDFDMANYVVRSPVTEVFARGAVRVDPRIGDAGDVDTAVTVLTHEDGTLTTIDNSREAVYGFDQRVEAFGSGGMAVSDNPPRHAGWHRTRDVTSAQPLPWFFLDRYLESYRQEWAAFHTYLVEGGPSPVGTADARACTAVALAAGLSLREGRPVQVKEIG